MSFLTLQYTRSFDAPWAVGATKMRTFLSSFFSIALLFAMRSDVIRTVYTIFFGANMHHTKLCYLTLANQMGKHQRHCYFRTGVHGGHREGIMQNDPRVRYLYTLEVG